MSLAGRGRSARPDRSGYLALTVAILAATPAILVGQSVEPDAPEEITRAGAELSLGEALDLAHRNNPDFRIQASQQGVADWRVREAYGDLMPSANISSNLGYTASGERRFEDVVVGEQPDMLSSSYNLGFQMSLSGADLLRPRSARANARATEAEIQGASSGLVEEVTQAYLTVLEADAELEQARTELDRARSQVRQAEAQVEVGAATPLDIRRAEVQEGQAEVRVLQAENAVVTTRLDLGQSLGVELPMDVALTSEFELFEPELDTGELVARAMERNPVLLAARAQAEAAGNQVRMSRSQYLPSLNLSAGLRGNVSQANTLRPLVDQELSSMANQYQSCLEDNRLRELLGDPPRDCSNVNPERSGVEEQVWSDIRSQNRGFPFAFDQQPWSVSLTVSFPLFTGFSRNVQIEEARVSHSNAREQVRAGELQLRSQVDSGVRSVGTAHRTVELQRRIRETAAEELRLAQERFRLGLASSIEVVDAQANLSEAEREEIAAIYDFHRAFSSLESLIGEPLR